mmetsp:Transcript_131995/g.232431  ORF Transcript_131995/g.232431 Transcript_131995/m.232431 type:complete len:357 (+) Transcript_131995:61-1131(+)
MAPVKKKPARGLASIKKKPAPGLVSIKRSCPGFSRMTLRAPWSSKKPVPGAGSIITNKKKMMILQKKIRNSKSSSAAQAARAAGEEAAADPLEEARELLEETSEEEPAASSTPVSSFRQGMVRFNGARNALQVLEDAERRRPRRRITQKQPSWLKWFQNLQSTYREGLHLYYEQNFVDALPTLHRAFELAKCTREHEQESYPVQIHLMQQIAFASFNMPVPDYAQALGWYRAAHHLARCKYLECHAIHGFHNFFIAKCYEKMGKLKEAHKHCQEAVQIWSNQDTTTNCFQILEVEAEARFTLTAEGMEGDITGDCVEKLQQAAPELLQQLEQTLEAAREGWEAGKRQALADAARNV